VAHPLLADTTSHVTHDVVTGPPQRLTQVEEAVDLRHANAPGHAPPRPWRGGAHALALLDPAQQLHHPRTAGERWVEAEVEVGHAPQAEAVPYLAFQVPRGVS
jgi:hypothetical protein